METQSDSGVLWLATSWGVKDGRAEDILEQTLALVYGYRQLMPADTPMNNQPRAASTHAQIKGRVFKLHIRHNMNDTMDQNKWIMNSLNK